MPVSAPRVEPVDASYDPDLYASLVAVEDRHFWFRARNRAIVAVFESIRNNLTPGYRLLEVGCGTGNVLRDLQKAAVGGTVIGMDLYHEGLRYARRRLDPALLVRADAGRPPFSVKFDVVGLFDVLEHLDHDVEVLQQLRELLGVRGVLLLTVPADPRLWSYFDVAAHHRRRYGARELHDKLVAAGYTIEYLTPYMSAIHPFLWAGRRLAALRHPSAADPLSAQRIAATDLRVRPLSGAVFGFLLGWELGMLRSRRRLRFGASLLAVARAASS
jgi:SAM-dependent methyltransferase